jgi:hypothetical protein
VSALWGQDYDLWREQREDNRRDEPDPDEMRRAREQTEAYEQEIASRPIGTSVASKKVA